MKCELLSNNQLIYYCEGCDQLHAVDADRWNWNKSTEKPTLSPSVLHRFLDSKTRCHYFIKDGMIQFLNDCTHHMKGKTVKLKNYKEQI